MPKIPENVEEYTATNVESVSDSDKLKQFVHEHVKEEQIAPESFESLPTAINAETTESEVQETMKEPEITFIVDETEPTKDEPLVSSKHEEEIPIIPVTLLEETEKVEETRHESPQIDSLIQDTPKVEDSSPELIPAEAQIPISEPEKEQVKEAEVQAELPSINIEKPENIEPSKLKEYIETMKEELKRDQDAKEAALIQKMEESFNQMLEQLTPKINDHFSKLSSQTTSSVLASQYDFTKSSAEDIKNNFEQLIEAYESRIESLGIRNYDLFLDKIKEQKGK